MSKRRQGLSSSKIFCETLGDFCEWRKSKVLICEAVQTYEKVFADIMNRRSDQIAEKWGKGLHFNVELSKFHYPYHLD